jgi:hypothetical protein
MGGGREEKQVTNQIVETPVEFLRAVEDRFGTIGFDLAATRENNVMRRLYHQDPEVSQGVAPTGIADPHCFGDKLFFGPGSTLSENAFLVPWNSLADLAWLNPPFADIEPWAAACAHTVITYRQRIAMLIPASVCTGYFIDYVKPFAYVFECTPRPFKKEVRDVILALYEPARYLGRETWKWR